MTASGRTQLVGSQAMEVRFHLISHRKLPGCSRPMAVDLVAAYGADTERA
jgi:hypothetical protein